MSTSSPSTEGAGAPPPAVSVEVRRLLSLGKCKQAIELAKTEHKRKNTPDTERLLFDAYVCRIDQFRQKNSPQDAQTLLKLVRERFPRLAAGLGSLEVQTAAVAGRVDDLVAPLADANLSPDRRQVIEDAIQQQLIDLPALAECRALPADHPLRVAAAAAWAAFRAATAGPVTEEQVALPEVSRRSPLAGWKLLVRAIAAFYRKDDDGARRAALAIPENAAVRPLAGVVLAMLDRKPPSAGLAGVLQSRVMGGAAQSLRGLLERVDAALAGRSARNLRNALANVAPALNAAGPELAQSIRQRVFARAFADRIPLRFIPNSLDPRRDAGSWKTMARALESRHDLATAAVMWNRFLVHALHEKLFPPAGPEAGAVWLHAARLAIGATDDQIEEAIVYLGEEGLLEGLYGDQPHDIAMLAPRRNLPEIVEDALDPDILLERAAEADPNPEVFNLWYTWAERDGSSDQDLEKILRLWRRKLPDAVEAPLLLAQLAEKRKAYKLALGHLSDAEAIDATHPMVRTARLRLTLATTWRHFKDGKPHLVEKDLAELAATPSLRDGDRAAFLEAVRAARRLQRGEPEPARAAYEAAVAGIGPVAAPALLDSVLAAAKVRPPVGWAPAAASVAEVEPRVVAAADARLSRLALTLRFDLERPAAWDRPVLKALAERPSPLPLHDVVDIARSAVERRDDDTAYAATVAGLDVASGAVAANLLFLRAMAMKSQYSYDRIIQCLRAASELARQANEATLLPLISAFADELPRFVRFDLDQPVAPDLLAAVLKAEREARSRPGPRAYGNEHVVLLPRSGLDFLPFDPVPRGDGGAVDDWDDDDEGDEADEFDDDFDIVPSDVQDIVRGLGEKDGKLLDRMLDKNGRMRPLEEIERDDPALFIQLLQLVQKAMGRGPSHPLPPPRNRKGRHRD